MKKIYGILINISMTYLRELQFKKDLKSGYINGLQSLENILKKYNWHFIGRGMDGALAEHPQKNYILKIFYSTAGYKEFVNFVEKHNENPHLPKFSRYVRKIPGTIYSYVRMEKLQEIKRPQYFKKYFPEIVYLYICGLKFDMEILGYSLGNEISIELTKYGYDHDDQYLLATIDLTHLWQNIGRKPKQDWVSIVDEMIKYADQIGLHSLDLHSSNMMSRNGTLVIIDPF